MAKARSVWISRDHGDETVCVEMWKRRPANKFGRFYVHDYEGPPEGFCYQEFHRVTGFKLKNGECKRVRIVIEEVK